MDNADAMTFGGGGAAPSRVPLGSLERKEESHSDPSKHPQDGSPLAISASLRRAGPGPAWLRGLGADSDPRGGVAPQASGAGSNRALHPRAAHFRTFLDRRAPLTQQTTAQPAGCLPDPADPSYPDAPDCRS